MYSWLTLSMYIRLFHLRPIPSWLYRCASTWVHSQETDPEVTCLSICADLGVYSQWTFLFIIDARENNITLLRLRAIIIKCS